MSQRAVPLDVDVQHHILPMVHQFSSALDRRLSPEKLAEAKAIFHQMVEDGICCPSSSPWATSIHIVKKESSEWRVFGDLRSLNAITITDRYSVHHLHDFLSMLRDKRVFTKLDLHMAYHEIPIAPNDIPKQRS